LNQSFITRLQFIAKSFLRWLSSGIYSGVVDAFENAQ